MHGIFVFFFLFSFSFSFFIHLLHGVFGNPSSVAALYLINTLGLSWLTMYIYSVPLVMVTFNTKSNNIFHSNFTNHTGISDENIFFLANTLCTIHPFICWPFSFYYCLFSLFCFHFFFFFVAYFSIISSLFFIGVCCSFFFIFLK